MGKCFRTYDKRQAFRFRVRSKPPPLPNDMGGGDFWWVLNNNCGILLKLSRPLLEINERYF